MGLFPVFSMTKHSQTYCSAIFECGVEVAVLVCLTILDLNLFQINFFVKLLLIVLDSKKQKEYPIIPLAFAKVS